MKLLPFLDLLIDTKFVNIYKIGANSGVLFYFHFEKNDDTISLLRSAQLTYHSQPPPVLVK